jgi:hypothetical protein
MVRERHTIFTPMDFPQQCRHHVFSLGLGGIVFLLILRTWASPAAASKPDFSGRVPVAMPSPQLPGARA